ncbi:Asp-tRNA(Asn)/Glu-tRNA(Gln) amidotransferase subunit GatC [Abyssibacter sp.]|jgi:aspartyl-tRNA(Asn)/glutamyl-tRNA(Gln) amidotransferase subunit C|uniref:Asp-tRNA(Asn)/Glu-tRNA(Gln) amidotransferase subunit GatC n=1 Tax=Abyssibacter sp. TaxID=2320200 RepID=UPI000C632B22|nr:Asp-tRNA(Asn)/Glu-tRNA(Gln) amidotransferase subunit GatC [Abyssibacter sp.]MBB88289.1 Asp-tRNA(Asn)/Glu-tRNA(Gln) amidotransferase GatCAB subunit C [Xanthomonadales bacterium]MCK5860451.1 Asp-tRNA(Asn)/Glu-tRNA(Gln) amidotransferase subunit GatC [Abyssibacter sp.]
MSLSKDQLRTVAHLARLELDEADVELYSGNLNDILSMVDQLNQADTTDVAPMAHPLDMVQRLRRDFVTETDQRELFQANAPATERGLYRVPRVIE